MQQYILRRLLLAVPTIIGVTMLIFVGVRVLPGDPLRAIQSEMGTYIFTDEELAIRRHDLGLDDPLALQYLSWMGDVLKGDMGFSFWRTQQPIRDVILRRLPITGQIAVMAVVMSWIMGLPVGIIAAVKRNSWSDYTTRTVATVFLAIPSFWFALTIVLVSVLVWRWRPPMEIIQLWENPWKNFQITIGPAFVFAAHAAAMIARMIRANLLEVLGEDYVRTARAKGLKRQTVLWRHALSNAVLPAVTMSGLQFAAILGGAVAVETAFATPGLGRALIQGMRERDWMIIQNLVLVFGLVYIFVNLAVDVVYAFIDPRIRY